MGEPSYLCMLVQSRLHILFIAEFYVCEISGLATAVILGDLESKNLDRQRKEGLSVNIVARIGHFKKIKRGVGLTFPLIDSSQNSLSSSSVKGVGKPLMNNVHGFLAGLSGLSRCSRSGRLMEGADASSAVVLLEPSSTLVSPSTDSLLPFVLAVEPVCRIGRGSLGSRGSRGCRSLFSLVFSVFPPAGELVETGGGCGNSLF